MINKKSFLVGGVSLLLSFASYHSNAIYTNAKENAPITSLLNSKPIIQGASLTNEIISWEHLEGFDFITIYADNRSPTKPLTLTITDNDIVVDTFVLDVNNDKIEKIYPTTPNSNYKVQATSSNGLYNASIRVEAGKYEEVDLTMLPTILEPTPLENMQTQWLQPTEFNYATVHIENNDYQPIAIYIKDTNNVVIDKFKIQPNDNFSKTYQLDDNAIYEIHSTTPDGTRNALASVEIFEAKPQSLISDPIITIDTTPFLFSDEVISWHQPSEYPYAQLTIINLEEEWGNQSVFLRSSHNQLIEEIPMFRGDSLTKSYILEENTFYTIGSLTDNVDITVQLSKTPFPQ
ncbi:MAG: hypothetical protein ATN36_06130 [Epulopiscium sp. Nele67-Bin005]|nr:MAG: hypothetical protein ATN36_06130 [Epulopiscium sp. Nele67-Bin005]